MGKIKNLIFNILLSLFSVVFVLVVIEVAARLLYPKQFINGRDFRKSRPEPYKKSDYFSERFIDESFQQPGKWISPKGTRMVYPDNFQGEYFHVRDHLRCTTDCPDRYRNF